MRERSQMLVGLVVLTVWGTYIFAAIYYITTQTTATADNTLHLLIPWDTFRHMWRNVYGALLGGLLGQFYIWNSARYHKKLQDKELNWLDRVEIMLHIPNLKDGKPLSVRQLVALLFVVPLYALPGFIIGFGIMLFFRLDVLHIHYVAELYQVPVGSYVPSPVSPLWERVEESWFNSWDQKLVGFGSAYFFGRRPAKGVFDDLQLFFVEQSILHSKTVHWYHSPTFKARYYDVLARGVTTAQFNQKTLKIVVYTSCAAAITLGGCGMFIMTVIATR